MITADSKLASVLGRLSDVEGVNGQFTARCPAHDDHRSSLSISTGDDGKILLCCHARCDFADIVAAIDLKPRDLMPDKHPAKPKGKFEIVATYNYFGPGGDLKYQVCRMNPKDFRQRRPKEGGGWVWSIKGVTQIPYNLYQMRNCAPSAAYYITEGEKDADRLVKLGLIATSNSGGAGKWPTDKTYLEWFRGRDVVVLVDNDDAGRKHGQIVAASLQGIAATVRVIELPGLPPKGDVSDWLDGGGTVEQLREIVASTPAWEPTNGPAGGPESENGVRLLCEPEQQTDLANARKFIERFGCEVMFVSTWKRRFCWDGRRWADDAGNVRSIQLMQSVADSVWVEAGAFKDSKDTVRFAQRTSSAVGIRSALSLVDPLTAIPHTVLDSNPWLFNCPNGTIDLQDGQLWPHCRETYQTKLCPTEYRVDASCPRWLQFLGEVFASQSLTDYVQRVVGCCLSGDVSDQSLWILYGSGANGKSTLLTTLQEVIGSDYASQAPPSLLTVKRGESHPTELASLHGKRMVVATESESGARLAESQVKQLTGGDVISARRMREDFWSFSPTHKLLMCTNHRPRVRGTDHAIWRRLRLIPFLQTFGDDRKDPDLPAKLRAEAAGILAWAVRGCLEWQRQGMNPPTEVRLATEEYRSSEDITGQFVSAECLTGSHAYRIRFSDLYDALERFCNDGGDNLPSKRMFGQWLRDSGYKEQQSNGRWYVGICLRA